MPIPGMLLSRLLASFERCSITIRLSIDPIIVEQIEKAEEKNNSKEIDTLVAKLDSLEQQVGPDYIRVMDGLGDVDPSSAEGQKFTAVLEPLHKQCK